jgi:putative cell wall-binding protein
MRRGVVLAVSVAAVLAAAVAGPASAGVDDRTERVAGATRVHTAVEVSRARWSRADHAVVATARSFPDALGGTALAASLDAPLLLSEADRLPVEVAAELVRIGATEVVLLGGEAALSPGVARAIAGLATEPAVRRVGGRDRWETAALAAGEALAGGTASEVAIASGVAFPDALVSGALPGAGGRVPVLLSGRDRLPRATRDALEALRPGRVLLAGGTSVLGEPVAAELGGLAGEVERISGPDRYSTAARWFEAALARLGAEPRPLVVATGGEFADALAAGALAARLDGVLLLVPASGLTAGLDELLRTHRDRLSSAVVVGGRGALAAHVRSEVAAALDGRPRPTATVTSPGGFRGTASALPGDVAERMHGVSWRPGCPVGLGDLALLELAHRTFEGGSAGGVMVVHRDRAHDVLGVFAALYDARFPLARVRLVDDYGADDDASMDADNTHAFNCRHVAGTTRWSEHAYGRAIDLNPVENPYVSGSGAVSPPAGSAFVDRQDARPGMVVDPGPVVEAFAAVGWGWGGDWTSIKDYQHFSATGR